MISFFGITFFYSFFLMRFFSATSMKMYIQVKTGESYEKIKEKRHNLIFRLSFIDYMFNMGNLFYFDAFEPELCTEKNKPFIELRKKCGLAFLYTLIGLFTIGGLYGIFIGSGRSL